MSKIWKLFVGDVRRMVSNIVSVIVVIGLTAIPAVFTWFNVAASWDPFSATGNLKFAVASDDEGYRSDLMPMNITVGDTIISTLRSNNQMDWTFTTSDKAIEGTKSGEYYAAVIIPKDFSRNMMTFFTDDATSAKIEYYVNDKKNALAPIVTNQGASTVSAQVNQIFAQTITTVAFSLAEGLVNQLDANDAQSKLTTFNRNVAGIADDIDDLSGTIDAYDGMLASASTLMTNSASLLSGASSAADNVSNDMDGTHDSASAIASALTASANTLGSAIKSSADGFAAVGASIDQLYADADRQAADTATAIRNKAATVSAQAKEYQTLRNTLETLINKLPDGTAQSAARPLLDQLDSTITRLNDLASGLTSAADAVDEGRNTAGQDRQHIKDLAAQAKQSVNDLDTSFANDMQPQLTTIANSVSDAALQLAGTSADLDAAVGDLISAADSASGKINEARATLGTARGKLSDASAKIRDFTDKLGGALSSGDMGQVKDLLSSAGSPEDLAAKFAAPVTLNRQAVFHVANFGSSMAPFYSTISMWVGALLMCVTLKPTVSRKTRKALGDPLPHQLYLGHYGIFGLIGLMQSTFLNAGSLLFMHVQSEHPLLYMVTGWVTSLVFTFITYTLVASFGNVGKAFGVLILIIQVSGANGAYPIQVLPAAYQAVSPFLPATHAIRAFRSAIAGIYDNDLWMSLGSLLLFIPPMLLLGLVLRKPLIRFNTWYVAKVESTKLI